jgi:hypothetical protein
MRRILRIGRWGPVLGARRGRRLSVGGPSGVDFWGPGGAGGGGGGYTHRVGFRPIFGQTWPQNPSRTTGLVLQCRLHQKSAPQTNSKAISWHRQIPARLPSGPSCRWDFDLCQGLCSCGLPLSTNVPVRFHMHFERSLPRGPPDLILRSAPGLAGNRPLLKSKRPLTSPKHAGKGGG